MGDTFTVEDGHMISGQSSLGLDAHQQRTASPGRHTLSWEVFALEAQRERSFLNSTTSQI